MKCAKRTICSAVYWKRLRFDVGAATLPHPRKTNGGEDAFFFVESEESGSATMGVADGVSAANDGGKYAQSLMDAAASLAPSENDPYTLMHAAWTRAACIEGRSTACLASVANDERGALLRLCNLGDSGCFVLRPRGSRVGVAYRTRPQLWEWNCPFQLGTLDGTELNSPADATADGIELHGGDVVLLATDGLTDALHPLEILELVAHDVREGKPASHMAQTLVETAIQLSKDGTRNSPVAEAMTREGHVARSRELQDDVTVVACRVLAAD